MTDRNLCDSSTTEVLRKATEDEAAESDAEIAAGRQEGHILVDGRRCYVEE